MPTVLRVFGPLPVVAPVLAPWAGRDTVLRSLAPAWGWAADAFGPGVQWEPTADGRLRLTAELPGFEASDVRMRAEGGVLHLTAVRQRRTRFGEEVEWVRRSLVLPHAVDPAAVQARLRMGLLTVELPRREEPPAAAPAVAAPAAPSVRSARSAVLEEAQVVEEPVRAPWWARLWAWVKRWVALPRVQAAPPP